MWAPSSSPGLTVAGYHVEALIGRGGMGAVYRAEELTLGRKVALKVIAPELAQDSRFRERFLRESRMAASLDHPHIVPIFKAGEEDGALFLAMRYVEGTDLGKLLAEGGALSPARAIALLEQVADGLDAAHEKGLVHRDVKPSNVLISRAAGKEHGYLADFGLTKRTGSLSGVSVAGEVVGTIEYVAPEQITGDAWTRAADLYSLGCVLYECLTGQSPFPRATDVALLWAHVHEDAPPPRRSAPSSPAIDGVLARALAKDPARRYSSADELVSAARSALGLVETAPARPARRPTRARRRGLPSSSSPRCSASCSPATRAAASLGSPRTRSASSTPRPTARRGRAGGGSIRKGSRLLRKRGSQTRRTGRSPGSTGRGGGSPDAAGRRVPERCRGRERLALGGPHRVESRPSGQISLESVWGR